DRAMVSMGRDHSRRTKAWMPRFSGLRRHLKYQPRPAGLRHPGRSRGAAARASDGYTDPMAPSMISYCGTHCPKKTAPRAFSRGGRTLGASRERTATLPQIVISAEIPVKLNLRGLKTENSVQVVLPVGIWGSPANHDQDILERCF